MEKRIIKLLCLLFVMVCVMLSMTSIVVFAFHNNGNTEVTAHIEAPPPESSQSQSDDSSTPVIPDGSDNTDVSTGDTTTGLVMVVLILIIISMLTMYLCIRNNRQLQKEK